MAARSIVVFFKDIDKNDIPLVGGKGANLGEMTKAGFPVPEGFAVTVEGYSRFLKENNLEVQIKEILDRIDRDNPESLQDGARQIQKKINSGRIPETV